MNYWLLTTEFPPAHGGGISTYCRCTAEMLAGSGVKVTVVVSDEGVRDYEIVSYIRNLLVVRFNPDKRPAPKELGGSARISYAFYIIISELISMLGRPDIIESQDYLGIAYYLQQFKLLKYEPFRDIPVLITIHAPAFVYWRYNKAPVYRFPEFWTGEMEKNSIRAADLLVSPSKYMADEVGQYMDLSDKMPVLLPYPYRPVSHVRRLSSSFQRNKIVYYGKLSPQKGTFELLRYFSELWRNGFPHPLYIIGGTDIVYHPEKLTMGQLLKREYGEYMAQGLILLQPAIDPADIEQALGDAHVVLLPSIVDNLPYVCLETLSCGKIVLASIQGGQREIIIDGENGFLFDHNCPASFGKKLLSILGLPDQEANRIRMNALSSIKRYSYENIILQKLTLLEGLIGGHELPGHYPFVHRQKAGADEGCLSPDALLSVVIPYYNLGEYLEECIGSILSSTYGAVEIIIVNDGASRACDRIALDRWRGHSKVTVVDQENQGLAITRNVGALKARGTFLAFLDADDAVLPDYYEKAIRVLVQYKNVHFVGCWVQYFDGSFGAWPTFNPCPPYLLTHNTVNSSALVYKKASFLAAGLNDPALIFGLEDYESVVSMLHRGFNGIALPECLHRYRVREGSMFRRISRDKLLFSNGYIMEKHRAYYEQYALDIAQLLNSNGPGYLYDNPTFAIQVNSRTEKSGRLKTHLKRIVRRNKALKRFFLHIRKKTYRIWQTIYSVGS